MLWVRPTFHRQEAVVPGRRTHRNNNACKEDLAVGPGIVVLCTEAALHDRWAAGRALACSFATGATDEREQFARIVAARRDPPVSHTLI